MGLVSAPMKVFLDEKLRKEYGQEGSYPCFIKDLPVLCESSDQALLHVSAFSGILLAFLLFGHGGFPLFLPSNTRLVQFVLWCSSFFLAAALVLRLFQPLDFNRILPCFQSCDRELLVATIYGLSRHTVAEERIV